MDINTSSDNPLSEILDILAQELDPPKSLRDAAAREYMRLARWIQADSQDRYNSDAELYIQGSNRLGTAICPRKKDDDLDIDLVYRRDIQRSSTSQEALVNDCGDQLLRYCEEYEDLFSAPAPSLEPGRRCWTLQFENQFHMDVLPALPDDEGAEFNTQNIEEAVIITDRELREWQHSNPKGYAAWFDAQQKTQLTENRYAMAQAGKVEIEDIPTEIVPTPLRRAIQLLKLHRDIKYDGNRDDKPISIIITTLAAKSYQGEGDPNEAIRSLAKNMRSHIEDRDGVWWVPNPISNASNGENFADKWEAHPERATKFFEWLDTLKSDLEHAGIQQGLDKVSGSLSHAFGSSVVERSMKRYGDRTFERRKSGELKMASGTGRLGTTGDTNVKGHIFFGS